MLNCIFCQKPYVNDLHLCSSFKTYKYNTLEYSYQPHTNKISAISIFYIHNNDYGPGKQFSCLCFNKQKKRAKVSIYHNTTFFEHECINNVIKSLSQPFFSKKDIKNYMSKFEEQLSIISLFT